MLRHVHQNLEPLRRPAPVGVVVAVELSEQLADLGPEPLLVSLWGAT
jgi:hypothetical protein